VDVTGNTTYSRDIIAKKITLTQVKIGDWLELHDAGSYCYSMITRFLGQEMPAEYLIRTDGRIETIREAEHYFGDAA
jgi:diaminopimelate decarboxylase